MSESVAATSEPTSNAPGFLVVGVGASAGGLEAFMLLLEQIPRSAPLALVLVQHLARDHESMLPQLLAAKTELTIRDGVDGERILPGHAYVIRPNTHMSVIDGHLRVQPRPPGRAHDCPIDHLFTAMADQYRDKAIGVVLSGGGNDGAFGVQRIHAAGGISFAQTLNEATVDSMPRAAIATGATSLVLSAHEIAAELVQLSAHPFYQHNTDPEAQASNTEEDLQGILRVLRRATSVDFTRYKPATIRRRIQRRMAIHHTQDLTSYLPILLRNPDEAKQLHDDILIHVTSFFRERETFEALRHSVLPKLFQIDRGEAPIRCWVPGCASGEDAYSLAITLLEAQDEQKVAIPITVFGTDLSQRMIERARAAFYPDNIAADIPPDTLRRYFVKMDGGYRVSTEVRERCVFARQDITKDPPFSKLDLVLCRNLFIYLNQSAQRKATEILHYALLPHGILALGRSETIGALPELFAAVDSRWKIYKRKQTVVPSQPIEFGAHSSALVVPAAASRFVRRERDFQAEANRLLLERYAPPLVVVDESLRVVRAQGRTAPFLELPSGEVSFDLLRMVRPGLISAVRTALQDVRNSGMPARKEGVEFRTDEMMHSSVNIEVSRMGDAVRCQYLILFEAAQHTATESGTSKPVEGSGQQSAVDHLQVELSDTRANLHSLIQELEAANEELQSANEEILSSNEELQSTNEELDTAREELQATNEELGTVNEELQGRNSELSRANGDLLNLLDSIDVPIVMVTSELKIRRFTRAAERTLNLIASDIGRPIGHLKPNIGFPDLEAVLRDVIDRTSTHQREVQDHEGRTYLASIRPYTNLSNRIDGAVLALLDVSESLRVARETGEALMSTVRDPILLLDSNFVVQRANHAFYAMFQVAAEQTEGCSLFDLGQSQWDLSTLRELLQEILPQRRNFEGFVVEHDFPRIGFKRMLVDGRRIGSGRQGEGIILLIIREEPAK